MTTQSLHTKYRPNYFDEVVGQNEVVKSLESIIQKRRSQTFLFMGPSGTGKTTLARICAFEVGCNESEIVPVDAATHTGVDEMRNVVEKTRYIPIGGMSTTRAFIIDECHMLSKSAWNSLLMATEEPPPYIFWFFCTTEPGKIPKTIETRCSKYTLRLMSDADLEVLLDRVLNLEKAKLDPGVRELVIKEARGSARQLLVNLGVCLDVTDRKAAAVLLQSAEGSDATIELCRFLIKGGSWQNALGIVGKFNGESPEGIRIVVNNYVAAVLKNAKSGNEAIRLLTILDAFADTYNASENMAPLYRSIGRVVFAEAP